MHDIGHDIIYIYGGVQQISPKSNFRCVAHVEAMGRVSSNARSECSVGRPSFLKNSYVQHVCSVAIGLRAGATHFFAASELPTHAWRLRWLLPSAAAHVEYAGAQHRRKALTA